MPDPAENSVDIRWGPERFYWSIVESPGPRGHGWADPDTLGALAEKDIPLASVDSGGPALHAVWIRLDGARVLVCAVERARLGELPGAALTLSPSSLPEFVDAPADPAALNLLVGPFEPASVRRGRARRRAITLLGAVASSAILCAGLARHAHAWREQARASRVESSNAAMRTLGRASIVDPAEALREELGVLRRAHASPTRETPDAAVVLGQLLSRWPAGCTPTMLAVSPEGITASAVVEDRRMLDSLPSPPGFEARPPRLSRAERGTAVALRWARVADQPSAVPTGAAP